MHADHQEYHRDRFAISTDPSRLDIERIHDYICNESYWAQGIPKETLERALANSLCFGVYEGEQQIGLARVVTDRATYAYLCDVYILESYRGEGLGKWLMSCVLAHPDLQGLRRFTLGTRDAHGLYRQFGFDDLKYPEKMMEIRNPDVYRNA